MEILSVILLILIFIMTLYVFYEVYAKDNPYEIVNLEDIEISKSFSKSGISKKKLERKDAFYIEFGYFQDRVILDEKNLLLDGYSTYLLAKQNGIKEIEIIRDKNEGIK